jgi:hypothetical protein
MDDKRIILIPKEYHNELWKVSPKQLKNTIEQLCH